LQYRPTACASSPVPVTRLWVWNSDTGRRAFGPFTKHSGIVTSVAFAPDSRFVVSCSHDQTILVWDVATGDVVAGPFLGHDGWVTTVSFSPDGKRIASSEDDTIRVWDIEANNVGTLSQGHDSYIDCVHISTDGTRLVSGSEDRTVRVWDAETGLMMCDPFTLHAQPIKTV
jgi:WD40 repeat protein